MPDSSIHGIRIGLCFSPIVNLRFGATAGYTGSRGTGEVRPRGKPCCHWLQSADSGRSDPRHLGFVMVPDSFLPYLTEKRFPYRRGG
jgi:hypothetical protein